MIVSFAAAGAFRGPESGAAVLANPTAIQFGPDGRLYVSEQNGAINAFAVALRGDVWVATAHEELLLPDGSGVVRGMQNHNDDGSASALTNRQVTGILVAGDPARPVLYVTSSDPRIGGASGDSGLDTNSSVLSRVSWTGTAWDVVDLVRGLPRSEENHAANGLALDAVTNTLYVAQGGNTNNGAPSRAFAYLGETAMAGTILAVDLTALEAMPILIDPIGGRGGKPRQYVYDLPTLDDPTTPNDGVREDADGMDLAGPWGGSDGLNMAILPADAPLRIYADGVRNPYDLVLTQGGRLFTVDNGSNDRIGGDPALDAEGRPTNQPADGGVGAAEPLFEIRAGGYYGHPVPIRANPQTPWIVFDDDGAPDPGVTPNVVVDLTARVPVGVQIAPGFLVDPSRFSGDPARLAQSGVRGFYDDPTLGALAVIGSSSNGLVEYLDQTAFDGALAGDLLVAQFNGSIGRLTLSADGASAEYSQIPGLTGLSLPLDVTVGPGGTVWVTTLGEDDVKVFRPAAATPVSSDADGDGVVNAVDPFQRDAANGSTAVLRAGGGLVWDFDPDQDDDRPGPDGFGGGLTGVMIDGLTDFEAFFQQPSVLPGQNIQLDNVKFITAALGGATVIEAVAQGEPTGAANDGRFLFHTGFAVDPGVTRFTVAWTVQNPGADFTGPSQQIGGYLGVGDQDSYLRLVAGPDPRGQAQALLEDRGVVIASAFFAADGLFDLPADVSRPIRFELDVDRASAMVAPRLIWRTAEDAPAMAEGPALSIAGTALLDAIEGRLSVGGAPQGVAAGLYATNAGQTPADAFPAIFDGIEVTAAGGALGFGVTETSVNVATSSARAGTWRLTNLGDSVVTEVRIDLDDALFPGVVFDPFGLAGDTASVPLQIDAAGGTGVVDPTSYNPYVGLGGDAGFLGLILRFDPDRDGGFQPGETVLFSVDADHNSLAGGKKRLLDDGTSPAWDAGGVSGAEMIGARFTARFADGGMAEGRLFGTGAAGGGRGVASEAAVSAAPPLLSVNGLNPGEAGTYGAGDARIVIEGPAGQTARIVLAKGFIQPTTNLFFSGSAADQAYAPTLQAQLDALAASAFPANNAVEILTVDVLLTGAPQDVSALFDLSGVAALDFSGEDRLALGVVAALVEPSGARLPLSAPTAAIHLRWRDGDAAPVVAAASAPDVTAAGGASTTVTVTYADDSAIAIGSLDVSDIVVTGPNGALVVTGVSVTPTGDGTPRTVSYAVAAPGGTWDPADNGAYVVALVPGEVLDDGGLVVLASALTSFDVTVPAPPPPPARFRVETEAFEVVQGFIVGGNGAASGGRVLFAGGSGEQIARHVFTAASGTYDLDLGYFDESDGAASLAVFVNGAQIDSFSWNQDLGSALAGSTTRAVRAIDDVALRTNDVIEIHGFRDGGEPLRTDFLDVSYVDQLIA